MYGFRDVCEYFTCIIIGIRDLTQQNVLFKLTNGRTVKMSRKRFLNSEADNNIAYTYNNNSNDIATLVSDIYQITKYVYVTAYNLLYFGRPNIVCQSF